MKRLVAIFITLILCLSAGAQKLIPFLPDPEKATGEAVIVCPGGSYYWLSRKVEGTDVAEKLQAEGIAAFVLYYRRAGTRYFLFGPLAFPQTHYPSSLNDLQDAIIEVKSKADEYGIDSSRVGVMGFSAGGHLVLNSAEEVVTQALPGTSDKEQKSVSSRPSFVAAIYPVVTMSNEEIVHKRSRRALLGNRRNDEELRRKLSIELNVHNNMPQVFLANCKDDPTVDWRNSMVLDSALTAASVPHEYHRFDKGGHGFGSASEDADWLPLFLRWLRSSFTQ
jgi:acetyl esterase/lipase